MKNYTRFEHEDMMFSFNHTDVVTEEVLINKLTEFLLAMSVKVSTTVEFNIRATFEDMLREEEAARSARQIANLSSGDDDLPF